MRRLLILGLAPLLASAADPVRVAADEAAQAQAEQQRLDRAAADARSGAERAAAQSAAAAQAIVAIDARIALAETQLLDLRRRREAAAARLAEARRPTAALLAGLAEAARRPAWLALAGARTAEEQVRLAALVRTLGPEVERRSAGLRRQLDSATALERRQGQLQAQLASERDRSAKARQRLLSLEQALLASAERNGALAFGATDRVIDRSERVADLAGEAEQRRLALRLAAQLAALPPAEARPLGPEGAAPDAGLAWQVPATGPVSVGMGELLANGVRSRGVTIAAAAGTQVTAPAAGTVAFAGPFRRQAAVVVIDHGGGFMTLLTGTRASVRAGERVAAGTPVGRALGPVTAELFHGGTAEPAALIARSSSPLLTGGSNR
ncbi:murein hydrolase activator EnvC family protein [Sphingomonas astaxanthinifaciens]|uniref:murein hydrolase activator EnvC family protein n=2 Tax=Sphingomonas astaxanthinifaciens TaxID=407019 RepID=UPI00055E443C|nr:peptidoglycan DD-metalloendopeptidase family protein [Sphingomonas astaxanthinifaciens]